MMLAQNSSGRREGEVSTYWPEQCFPPCPWDLTSLQTMLFPSPVQILRILPGPAQVLLPYMKWPLSILLLMEDHLFSSNQTHISISLFSTAL